MKCPVCQLPLQITERQGVEIDYCTQCRGVWLDRGELDKILERATGGSVASIASPGRRQGVWEAREEAYDDDEDDEDKRYRSPRRKKSFLRDLFDFG